MGEEGRQGGTAAGQKACLRCCAARLLWAPPAFPAKKQAHHQHLTFALPPRCKPAMACGKESQLAGAGAGRSSPVDSVWHRLHPLLKYKLLVNHRVDFWGCVFIYLFKQSCLMVVLVPSGNKGFFLNQFVDGCLGQVSCRLLGNSGCENKPKTQDLVSSGLPLSASSPTSAISLLFCREKGFVLLL